MGVERRGCVIRSWLWANLKGEEPVDKTKPYVSFCFRLNDGSRMSGDVHVRF
jgi:hypothetical protein